MYVQNIGKLASVASSIQDKVLLGWSKALAHYILQNNQSINGIYSPGWGARCDPGLKAQVNVVGDQRYLVSIAL